MASSMNGLFELLGNTLKLPTYFFPQFQTCNCSITNSRFFLNRDSVVSFIFVRNFYDNYSEFIFLLVSFAFLHVRQEKIINDSFAGTAKSRYFLASTNLKGEQYE
jgi:hypothetical protein